MRPTFGFYHQNFASFYRHFWALLQMSRKKLNQDQFRIWVRIFFGAWGWPKMIDPWHRRFTADSCQSIVVCKMHPNHMYIEDPRSRLPNPREKREILVKDRRATNTWSTFDLHATNIRMLSPKLCLILPTLLALMQMSRTKTKSRSWSESFLIQMRHPRPYQFSRKCCAVFPTIWISRHWV